MQKVVRQLCTSWATEEYECHLVIFQDGHYKILNKCSLSEIFKTYSERNPKISLRKKIWKILKPIYRKLLSKISMSSRTSIVMSRPARFVSKFLNEIPSIESSQEFRVEGINLLILELIFDPNHLLYILDLVKNSKVRLTFFSYDLIPINHPQYCAPEFISMFRKYLEISKYSRNLWSISDTTKLELEHYVGTSIHLMKSIFKWLPPSIYTDCQHSTTISMSHSESPYWLFVGSFEPRKNHLGFFEALRILKRQGLELPTVILVGGGNWNDVPITKGIKGLIYEGFNVIKLANINECCVGELYKGADLTVYPSHFEGFGLPVVESLSFGVPVIISDIGSTHELLTLPGTLGFEPGNSNDLALKLGTFIQSEKFREGLYANAKSNMNCLGTWKDYARELYFFATL